MATAVLVALFSLLSGCTVPPAGEIYRIPLESRGTDDRVVVRNLLSEHYERWRQVPYRNGGMSRRGVDCSGFVALTFAQVFGVRLPRTTEDLARSGRDVARRDMLPGDLVFFKTGWFSRHVGIYLEKELFLHASLSRGVTLSALGDPYWRRRFWLARRVID